VKLHIYADESYTGKASTLCGFIAAPEYWTNFSRRWNAVLNSYRAPYFHFREFVDKENRWKIPRNPYLSWSEKRRESFLYELAIVLSEEAVPVGGTLDLKNFRTSGLEGDTDEGLIYQFYTSVGDALIRHWPNFGGELLFVFDETDNANWKATLNTIHRSLQNADNGVRDLHFKNDVTCPPLQAADLYAYSTRQISERYYEQGKTKQVKRTLDWILSKNQYPKFKAMYSPDQWETLVKNVLADRKHKKALWARQGEPKKQYYPELHFEPGKFGLKLINADEI
jgi:hypothetical protein